MATVAFEEKKRVVYLDVLRVLASIAVVFIHASGYNWYNLDPISFEWNVLNFYDSISRWAVPIFVMISGCLFLDNKKETSIKKKIFRTTKILIFWSLLYDIYKCICLYKQNIDINIKTVISNFFEGNYHLWFLYMIIGLYLITPILKKITEDKRITEYFLLLSLIFTFIIPDILQIPKLEPIKNVFYNFHFHITLGFSSYFVLGHYINTTQISLKVRKLIYILSISSFVWTIVGSTLIANLFIKTPFGLYNSLSTNVLLQSVGVFIFVKENKILKKVKTNKINIAKYSLGIYLVHALIIDLLYKTIFNKCSINAIIYVPIVVLITYIISFCITYIISKIPKLNKLVC